MKTIDEIMEEVHELENVAMAWAAEGGYDPMTVAPVEFQSDKVRDLIATALEDARREGGEEMRKLRAERDELRTQIHIITGERDELADGMQSVRARLAEIEAQEPACYLDGGTLPLYERPVAASPAKRQAVRLTDEQVFELVATAPHTVAAFVRAVETAVLAANGLGDAQ